MTGGTARQARYPLPTALAAAERGAAAAGPAPSWRPVAAFLAQLIGERTRGTRLARARAAVPAILDSYGAAATLGPGRTPRLDRTI